jgi:KTSC domain
MELVPGPESPAERHYCEEASNGTGSDAQDAAGRDSDNGDEGVPVDEPVRASEDRQESLPVGRRDAGSPQIKLYAVKDKNMVAVGWQDGTLVVQFKFGLYHYSNVPEDVFVKISNPKQPYPNSLFTKLVKNHPELYPFKKVA